MENKSINVSINFSTILKTTLFFILLYLLYFFKDLALVILTSIVLASALEPLIAKIEKFKLPRIFATSIVYLLLLITIIGSLLIFIPPIIEQANSVYKEIPDQLKSLNSWMTDQSEQGGVISKVVEVAQEKIEYLIEPKVENENYSKTITQNIVSFFGSIFNFILIIVLSFYFAAQQHGIEKFLKIITPAKYTKYSINLWKRSQKKIGLWMQGQLILGLLIGVITYLGLLVFFGLDQALLIASLAIIAELIPVVGPFIVAIPAMMIGLTTGGWGLVGGVGIFFLVIQMIENQLIYPLVVKKVVGVPSILVIISLIIGYQLFGFLGVILSIPLAAILMEFIKDIEKKGEKDIKTGKEKEVSLAKIEK